jgi:hypothetical protein
MAEKTRMLMDLQSRALQLSCDCSIMQSRQGYECCQVARGCPAKNMRQGCVEA